MTGKPDWQTDGRDWPNREASRFVQAAGLAWHVQVMGAGPPLLLLHGTGAATHSWRDFAPILARTHTIVAPDLPGHGFTETPARRSGLSLPEVARGVSALTAALGLEPRAIVGHSAGAAIAIRMALDSSAPTRSIVSINGALLPFPGPLGPAAPALARTLFLNPLALSYFQHRAAHPGAVARLIGQTGSTIDEAGLGFYERLFRSRGHLEGTIGLMAHWDLESLQRDLPRLRARLTLISGEGDRAVPPNTARDVQRLVPNARIISVPELGHLAHEEAPSEIADLVLAALQQE